jgi:hypothetical protein
MKKNNKYKDIGRKTLRNYFVKDTDKTKLQNDRRLTETFKIISKYIFLFLFQGIFNIYLRGWQYKRNMELLEPYLSPRKIEILNKIGYLQFIENFSVLTFTLVISIFGLYYYNNKYEKLHKDDE